MPTRAGRLCPLFCAGRLSSGYFPRDGMKIAMMGGCGRARRSARDPFDAREIRRFKMAQKNIQNITVAVAEGCRIPVDLRPIHGRIPFSFGGSYQALWPCAALFPGRPLRRPHFSRGACCVAFLSRDFSRQRSAGLHADDKLSGHRDRHRNRAARGNP